MPESRENYETFCHRLRPVLSPRDLMLVELAYVLAKHGHRAQYRNELDPETGKRIRYFEHPRRVALILIDVVRCVDPVVLQAALVHDGFEDTRLLRPEFIEAVLGSEVASIVKMLSKVPKEGYIERLASYADWRALVIKACDRLDNLRSLGDASPEFQWKQVSETREKYFPVFTLMVRLVPARYRKGAAAVFDEIRRIVRAYGRQLAPRRRRLKLAACRRRHS